MIQDMYIYIYIQDPVSIYTVSTIRYSIHYPLIQHPVSIFTVHTYEPIMMTGHILYQTNCCAFNDPEKSPWQRGETTSHVQRLGLLWLFLAVAAVSDIFMGALASNWPNY